MSTKSNNPWAFSQEKEPNSSPALFGHIKERVKSHLISVYSLLLVSIGTTGLGVYVSLNKLYGLLVNGLIVQIVSFLGVTSCFLLLRFLFPYYKLYSNNSSSGNGLSWAGEKNGTSRRFLFCALSFFFGLGMGSLVELSNSLDPNIFYKALSFTFLIFGSLSASVLLNPSKKIHMYVGFIIFLTSGLSAMFFFGSFLFRFIPFIKELVPSLLSINTYLGLVTFSLYIIYDTNLIIERSEKGKFDVVGDAVGLYLNLFNILNKLLIIMIKKNQAQRREAEEKKASKNKKQ